MACAPPRLFPLALLGVVACGRTGLDGLDAPDASAAAAQQDATDLGAFADDGARTDAPATPPPTPGDDASVTPEARCAEAPPRAAECPATEPQAGAAACRPGVACAYARSGGAEVDVAIYTCALIGEDATGWKEADVPCASACFADGGSPLDAGGCQAREVMPCAPVQGQTAQDLLDNQVFGGDCAHHEGTGGFWVRFDSQGCATSISGGAFAACDVTWLTTRRFACALDHPCAVAPTPVK